jgi:hypothetical protein
MKSQRKIAAPKLQISRAEKVAGAIVVALAVASIVAFTLSLGY